MKKKNKILLLIGAIALLLISTTPAYAINYSVEFTDTQGDVRDSSGEITSAPNIDITNIKSYKEDQTVYFELKVAGSIIGDSDEYIYMIQIGGVGAEIIQVIFSNGNASYIDQLNPQNSGEAEYTIEDNTLTLGVAAEVFSDNIVLRVNTAKGNLGTSEPDAIDIAPNDGGFSGEGGTQEEEPEEDETEEDEKETTNIDDTKDSNGDGSPGFEIIILLIAIGIALILFRRKK